VSIDERGILQGADSSKGYGLRVGEEVRVGQCIDGLERGGAEQIVRLLVKYADPLFKHHIYAFADGPMAAEIQALGAPVTIVRRRMPKLDPSLIWRLSRALRADGIRLLHTHIFGACLHGRLAAMLLGRLPVVVTEHNVATKYKGYQRLTNRWLSRWSQRIVAVSDEVGRSLTSDIGVSPEKVRIVCNGVDTDHFATLPTREAARDYLKIPRHVRVVGSIGRLTRQKGYGYLLQAMSILLQDCSGVHLVLVGKGEQRSALEQQASELGISENTHFVGLHPDIRRLLPAFDVFAMSSLWEGLPMALLEAMAAGLPCVATTAGGIVNVIDDGVNGLLVPPADPGSLAAAIKRVIDKPQEAQRMGEHAKTTVERDFSARRMTAEYEDVYREVLSTAS